jgi:CheY-like chemotaxis protein
LAQVIDNLLSNAVKFTPEGGTIKLIASFIKEEQNICTLKIEVIDSGIGISDEQKARLFCSFQQADSSISRRFGGTGLGLAISKRIVEMMGGGIWVHSKPNEGSAFGFTFEVKRGGDVRQNLPKSGVQVEQDSVLADNFKGFNLLLAEDIEINREIVIALLEPTELGIHCAENGAEALDMFEKNAGGYDMIFMDIQMPEMDGYEATHRIRALDMDRVKNIPIVAMTANVFRQDIEKCLAAGMNDHVGKPLNFDEVLTKLRKYLPRGAVGRAL